MKYFFSFFVAVSLLITAPSHSVFATVFRVNNGLTENITGRLFSQIQTAHDHFSVRNGDTLMVESSGKAYDGFTATKRLVIIGPGFFLGDNNGVNGVVASASVSGIITFKADSQGSYFIGMESIYYLTLENTKYIYIIRSNIKSLNFSKASNCKVTGSFISYIDSYLPGSDISITNSIIDNDNSGISYVTYENNIITGDDFRSTSRPLKISAGTFRNNILIDRDAKVEIKSPNIQNNFGPNEQFGTTNGNRAYEAADLFVGGTSSDGKYRIKANSPYIAAGYGGTQPGIFGGSEPYTLSGIPPIPIIYELNVPGTGSAASGLSINVKIRGAN